MLNCLIVGPNLELHDGEVATPIEYENENEYEYELGRGQPFTEVRYPLLLA